MQDCIHLVESNQDENRKFFGYVTRMLEAYASGDRAAKRLADGAPTECLERVTSFSFDTKVKGKMILKSSYLERFGDPASRNHTVTRARWRDGTIQDVVLIPETRADEMDVEWGQQVGTQHKETIHDGEMTTDANQLSNIFGEMRDAQSCPKLTGEAIASAAAVPPPEAAPAGRPAGENAAVPGSAGTAIVIGDEVSDDEVEASGAASLFGMLLDGGGGGAVGGGAAQPAARGPAAAAVKEAVAPQAKAKRKASASKPSSAPPPLSGGGGGARKAPKAKASAGGGAGIAVVSGDKAEKELKALLGKATDSLRQIAEYQKASVLSIDKKFYKSTKQLSDSIEMKSRGASSSTRQTVSATLKIFDIIVKIIKGYKFWVRKMNTVEFLTELDELVEFSTESPEVKIELPSCMRLDIIEMRFSVNLPGVLKEGDKAEVKERFRAICLTHIAELDNSQVLSEWQVEVINNALLSIMKDGTDGQQQQPDHLAMLQCFFSPLPLLPEKRVDFEISEDIKDRLLILKAVLETGAYAGKAKEINDYITDIQRGSNGTFKIISGMPAGRKVLTQLRATVKEQMTTQQSLDRIADLCSKQDDSLEHLVNMDNELQGVGFKIDEQRLQRFAIVFEKCVARIAAEALDILQNVLHGKCESLQFLGLAIGHNFENIRKGVKAVYALKFMSYDELVRQHSSSMVPLLKLVDVMGHAPLKLLVDGGLDSVEMADLEDLAPFSAALKPFSKPGDCKTCKL